MLVLSFYQSLPLFSFVLHFLSPLPRRWRFAVAPLCGFMEDLVTPVITEVFNKLSSCLNCSENYWATLNMKRNRSFAFSLWLINPGGAHCHEWIFRIAKKRYFSCSPLSIALCNGASMRKYKAYRHMNFSLINVCGTRENNIHGHSFTWSGACEFTKYYNFYKKK